MTSYKKSSSAIQKSSSTAMKIFNAQIQLESSSSNLDISSKCNSDICHQVLYPWINFLDTNLSVLIFFMKDFLYINEFLSSNLSGKSIFLSWSFIDFRFQCYVLYNLMHENKHSTAYKTVISFIQLLSHCTESEHTYSHTNIYARHTMRFP